MKLLLCGPPGAGKTTVAERLREGLAAAGYDFRLLHSDDYSRNTYDRLYDEVAGDDADPDADWILDGTFYRREWQERFHALPDTHLVFVTASLETCLARNHRRDDPISETGVRVVHAEFDVPHNPDLVLDTDRLSADEAADALVRYVSTWGQET
ncbi:MULTISPECIES: AAA family ATPase [Halorussus]|uniref:AAA family ATPase n=1 Tax=Halorussus TaxID=1070314 RepID=UPI0020A1D9E8|nr:AAA family ATPase [Halorussus vallis]USZ76179.1 AAA family ATPase [Halorussus vallis]